jgi:hypothetical protein
MSQDVRPAARSRIPATCSVREELDSRKLDDLSTSSIRHGEAVP